MFKHYFQRFKYNKYNKNNIYSIVNTNLYTDTQVHIYLVSIIYFEPKLDYLKLLSNYINKYYKYDVNYSTVLSYLLFDKNKLIDLSNEELVKLDKINEEYLQLYLDELTNLINIHNLFKILKTH